MAPIAFYCEADEEFHEARADPETGMCPYCSTPPEPLVPQQMDVERDWYRAMGERPAADR